MAVLKKKIWPEYFEAVKSGKKKAELRLADFAIGEGDTLVLEEWDPKTKEYTGRTIEKHVTYVSRFDAKKLKQLWPNEDPFETGLQIISLE